MSDVTQELIAAVRGSRGQLDCWLEVNNEADCRAAILPLIESAEQLRAELAAEREKVKELEEKMFANWAGQTTVSASIELAAAQATIAEMIELLEEATCYTSGPLWSPSMTDDIVKFLALTANQDALCEALARECERLAGLYENNDVDLHINWLREEAATHRARKETK